MPFIRIQTNLSVTSDNQKSILNEISKVTSDILSKSEQYIMLQFHGNEQLIFAGNSEGCAFLQLKSISLQKNQISQLSEAFCDVIAHRLEIINERIYIEFTNIDRSMWGWNKGTF